MLNSEIKFMEDNAGQTFEGLGFAIPSSIANRIITGIISNGNYKHPFIGIQGVFLDPLQIEINGLPPSIESGYLIKDDAFYGLLKKRHSKKWKTRGITCTLLVNN